MTKSSFLFPSKYSGKFDWVDRLSVWMKQRDPALIHDLTPELHYLGSQAPDFTVTDTPVQKLPVYKADISVHISGQKHYS